MQHTETHLTLHFLTLFITTNLGASGYDLGDTVHMQQQENGIPEYLYCASEEVCVNNH